MYYFMFNNRKVFGKSLGNLRMRILGHLGRMTGNMECYVPVFSDDGKIAEMDYLKEMKDGRVYYCYCDCRRLRTFRMYYDLDDRRILESDTIAWMEIPTMQGKQLIAKDVY